MKKILNIVFISIVFSLSIDAASGYIQQDTVLQKNSKEILELFKNIENGINSSNIDIFSASFSEKTYISLISGNSGYYSPGQSYYVLRDFLNSNKPFSFKLISMVSHSSSPFASGVLRYSVRGIRKQAMVFISLRYAGDHWRIAQITIN